MDGKLGAIMQALQGRRQPSAGEQRFNGLGDTQKSAVTQMTEGAPRRMPGIEEIMAQLQRRLPPEEYRAMMEDQLRANENPQSQMLRALGLQ
jgi:hypothetical protein